MEVLLQGNYTSEVKQKEKILLKLLVHPAIISRQNAGLWVSLQFKTDAINRAVIHQCIHNGLITDWFLFAPDRLRIAPPLTITEEELKEVCNRILKSIEEATN